MEKIVLFASFMLLPLAISGKSLLPSNPLVPSSEKTSVRPSKILPNGCYYSKPKPVLEKICKRGECRSVLNRNLKTCVGKVKNKLMTGIKHNGKVEYTEYLTYDIMDDVLTCMSQREGKNVSSLFPYRSDFIEVDYSVRSKHFDKSEKCLNEDCSQKTTWKIRPIIGKTKNLYYTF